MNKYCADVLRLIRSSGFTNQRDFALKTGFSLGKINQSLTKLIDEGYLETDKTVTEKTRILFEKCKPKNAIILAAGYGLRMVPLNTEIPIRAMNNTVSPVSTNLNGRLTSFFSSICILPS